MMIFPRRKTKERPKKDPNRQQPSTHAAQTLWRLYYYVGIFKWRRRRIYLDSFMDQLDIDKPKQNTRTDIPTIVIVTTER